MVVRETFFSVEFSPSTSELIKDESKVETLSSQCLKSFYIGPVLPVIHTKEKMTYKILA